MSSNKPSIGLVVLTAPWILRKNPTYPKLYWKKKNEMKETLPYT